MGQKLINMLGLYRINVKKRNDLPLTRILVGSGSKRHQKRSQSHDSTPFAALLGE
jgi:hypothetical protein